MPIRAGTSLAKNFSTSLRRNTACSFSSTPMNLKDMFGRIQPNPANRHSDGSFGCVDQPSQPGAFDAVGDRPPHPTGPQMPGGWPWTPAFAGVTTP